MTIHTLRQIYEAVAVSLREFGYTYATADMISDTHKAMKTGGPIPHGIIGMFANETADFVLMVANRQDMHAKVLPREISDHPAHQLADRMIAKVTRDETDMDFVASSA